MVDEGDGLRDHEHASDTVPHQAQHEHVIDERLDGIDAENEAIDDLAAITSGDGPTEAEHNAVRTKINEILDALRNSHIIPTE
jgi:hypothetical protein